MATAAPFELHTPRLLLTEVRDQDLDVLCEVLGDARNMRHYPAPYSRELVAETIARAQESQRRRGHCKWAVRLRTTGQLVGLTGLVAQDVDEAEELEVGWNLHPSHQGKGYATEAGERAVRFGFEVLGRDRIISLIVPANEPSQRVSERLGMRIVTSTMFGPDRSMAVDVWSVARSEWSDRVGWRDIHREERP